MRYTCPARDRIRESMGRVANVLDTLPKQEAHVEGSRTVVQFVTHSDHLKKDP